LNRRSKRNLRRQPRWPGREKESEIASTAGGAAISVERFVLDTVEQVRALAVQAAAEPEFAGVSISSITISIPFDAGAGQRPRLSAGRPLRPSELARFLRKNDRPVVLNRDRLRDLPAERLARIELTVELGKGKRRRMNG
jgi:hypothetical protein